MLRIRRESQRHSASAFRRKRRGAVSVEAAIIVPVFLVIVLYFIQFAWYFMVLHTVQRAADFGARSWAVQGYSSTEAEQRAAQYLTDNGFTPGSFQITAAVDANQRVTFTVSVPAAAGEVNITGDPFGILSWSGPLTGQVTMVSES